MKAAANPFRSSAIAEIRYRLDQAELAGLAARATAAPFRQCCLLGPRGSGKTTLLEDLEEFLQGIGFESHWIRLQSDTPGRERRAALRKLERLRESDVCLLDGGEVLSWWTWRTVLARSRNRGFRLIATLQRERGLQVLHRHRTDLQLALDLVADLAGPHLSHDLEATARAAFEGSAGDIREVFRACYLHCAGT